MRLYIAGLAVATASLLVACASAPPAPAALNDGELTLPAGYQGWAKFLSAVQRPDVKQVREIYMNDIAQKGTRDKGFPEGSVFVMENYAAETNADGSLKRGPDGKLVKGALVSVFVQGKNPGWGTGAKPELKTGNWVYSAYTPAGAKSSVNLDTCRACHLPLKDKDYVFRYDEYFNTVKTSALAPHTLQAALNAPHALDAQAVALAHQALR